MCPVALFSLLVTFGYSCLWLWWTAGLLWDHNNVRSSACFSLKPQHSHSFLNSLYDRGRAKAQTISVTVTVTSVIRSVPPHPSCRAVSAQPPQFWPLLYVMRSILVSASASLSFCVISGGTDGGHRAQGVLGYRGDKSPRGSQCGEPGDGEASPPRAGGLRQRPGAERGCPAWDR